MNYAYRVRPYKGKYRITLPDFPGIEVIEPTRPEAVAEIHRTMLEVLNGYLKRGLMLPSATVPAKSWRLLDLGVTVQMKLVLYHQMQRLHLSKNELIARLGLTDYHARRLRTTLFDVTKELRIDDMTAVAWALGTRVSIGMESPIGKPVECNPEAEAVSG